MESNIKIQNYILKYHLSKALIISYKTEFAFKVCLEGNSSPDSFFICKNKILNAYDKSLSIISNFKH